MTVEEFYNKEYPNDVYNMKNEFCEFAESYAKQVKNNGKCLFKLLEMARGQIGNKREMYTYRESDVKKMCLKLLGDFTNPEEMKDLKGETYEESFEEWFKQNKHKTNLKT